MRYGLSGSHFENTMVCIYIKISVVICTNYFFTVIFLVCIQNPSMECSNQLKAFDGERKLVSKGMKPKTNFRDYQWVEDELNFPSTYGKGEIRISYWMYMCSRILSCVIR